MLKEENAERFLLLILEQKKTINQNSDFQVSNKRFRAVESWIFLMQEKSKKSLKPDCRQA
jgi:hypothetical protein